MLEQFFENWRNEKTPITDEEFSKLSDVEKDVYDLFYEFYDPFNLNKLSSFNGEIEKYKDEKYVIINPRIKYNYVSTLNDSEMVNIYLAKHFTKEEISNLNDYYLNNLYKGYHMLVWAEQDYYCEGLINDFRPKVKFENARPLFQKSEYDSLITRFVGYTFYFTDSQGKLVGYSKDKLSFVNSLIAIFHQTENWYIVTSPDVKAITFDNNRNTAKLVYSSAGHMGMSTFKKENGKWVFVKDEMTLAW